MQENLFKRNIEKELRGAMSDTPVVIVQGARQTGKSTLVGMAAAGMDCKQVTLDDPALLAAAKNDPVSFVNQYERGTLIIDEAQLCPELLRAIKLSVDKHRKPGRYLLTGSADLLHVAGANESLVGRAETIRLYPFSMGEIAGEREDFVTALKGGNGGLTERLKPRAAITREDYADLVERGGFPSVVTRKKERRSAYFKNYLTGILDHDAAIISNLSHIERLSTLFAVLSAETGNVFVQTNVARKINVPDTSLRGYVRLLVDLNLINSLPAWGRNITKRAIGKPKISILDTGLACYQNGVSGEFLADLSGGEAFGALLESFVVNELFKQQTWSSVRYRLFHYHDREGREVDIIIELSDGRIIALEVKAARSISRKDFVGMNYLRDVIGERFLCGIVLYAGSETQQFGDRVYFAPVCSVWDHVVRGVF